MDPKFSTRTVVYSDLNCPFCYALHERLLAMDVLDQLLWCGIEHDPTLPMAGDPATPDQQRQLTAELAALRMRAPEISLSTPTNRPNSRPATLAIAAARTRDPVRSNKLRTLVFRALWRDGRDISDADVIADLCAQVGLPDLEITAAVERDAATWTRAWRDANFNRIPVMVSGTGSHLLGLTSRRELEVFLDATLYSAETPDSCG